MTEQLRSGSSSAAAATSPRPRRLPPSSTSSGRRVRDARDLGPPALTCWVPGSRRPTGGGSRCSSRSPASLRTSGVVASQTTRPVIGCRWRAASGRPRRAPGDRPDAEGRAGRHGRSRERRERRAAGGVDPRGLRCRAPRAPRRAAGEPGRGDRRRPGQRGAVGAGPSAGPAAVHAAVEARRTAPSALGRTLGA